jgi:anti-anti-sigma factor
MLLFPDTAAATEFSLSTPGNAMARVLSEKAFSGFTVMGLNGSRLNVDWWHEAAVVTFCDEQISDEMQVEELRGQILAVSENLGFGKLVLDFANVAFVGTPVFSLLLQVREEIEKHGMELELRNVRPHVLDVFNVTNLSGVFNFAPAGEGQPFA